VVSKMAARKGNKPRAVLALVAILLAAAIAAFPSLVSPAGAQKTKGNSPEFVAKINSPAADSGTYGSIALTNRGAVVYAGLAYGARNRAIAEKVAEEICGNALSSKGLTRGQACTAQIWFFSKCASFATSNNGSWGTGYGDTPAEACRWAQNTCSTYSKGCVPGLFVCSPGGKNGTCDGKFTQY